SVSRSSTSSAWKTCPPHRQPQTARGDRGLGPPYYAFHAYVMGCYIPTGAGVSPRDGDTEVRPMARSTPNQYPVVLDPEQRARLAAITRTGSAPVSKVRHAQVLLLSDGRRLGRRLTRDQIAAALGTHVNT